MQISEWIQGNQETILRQRRYLHAYPELSMQEFATTEYIATILRDCGLNPQIFPWGTGIYCDITPDIDPNFTFDNGIIAFRADIDALPIQEETGLSFSSTNAGVSHSCGHDIHTSILLGLAQFLAQADIRQQLTHPVRLIFQPAEEIMPGGAIRTIEVGVLEGVEKILALHCDPKVPVGSIGLIAGPITSASDIVSVQVQGSGGHTARPHLSVDVVGALAQLVNTLPLVLSRKVDPRSGTIMMWGSIHAGQAPNAIPPLGTVSGTVRTRSYDIWQELETLCTPIIEHVLATFEVGYKIDYQRGVPPVVNDSGIVQEISDIIDTLAHIHEIPTDQSGGGEDFSWYLEQIPGVMFRLGVGTKPKSTSGEASPKNVDLHMPGFIADEEAIFIGLEIFARYLYKTS